MAELSDDRAATIFRWTAVSACAFKFACDGTELTELRRRDIELVQYAQDGETVH